MNEETTNFRNVNSKFDLFFKNAVSCEVPDGYPKAYPEQEFTEDQVINVKRADGLVIEICDWHDREIYVTDISVDKKAFDALDDCSFEEYAKSQGIYTENIEINGVKYRYYNPGQKDQWYRLQYYMEN